jgi:hypothetical protein
MYKREMKLWRHATGKARRIYVDTDFILNTGKTPLDHFPKNNAFPKEEWIADLDQRLDCLEQLFDGRFTARPRVIDGLITIVNTTMSQACQDGGKNHQQYVHMLDHLKYCVSKIKRRSNAKVQRRLKKALSGIPDKEQNEFSPIARDTFAHAVYDSFNMSTAIVTHNGQYSKLLEISSSAKAFFRIYRLNSNGDIIEFSPHRKKRKLRIQ